MDLAAHSQYPCDRPYPPSFQEIAEPLFHLKLAMEQLSASHTFRYVLATVLAIGNFLNGCKVSILSLVFECTFPA